LHDIYILAVEGFTVLGRKVLRKWGCWAFRRRQDIEEGLCEEQKD
jgi:hypothetical protein